VNEVVLVCEKFHMFGAGVGAYEDHEVLVSAGRLGSNLSAVDSIPWNMGSLLPLSWKEGSCFCES
jgi:hypothetical protein